MGRVARRPRPLPAPRPQPLPARRGGGRRRRRRGRRRPRAQALAVRARLRHPRLHPAPAPRRHRGRRGQPPAPPLRRDRRARPVVRVGARARRRPRARARAGRLAPRRVRPLGGALDGVDRRRAPRRDLPRRLRAPLRAARDRLRAAPLARQVAHVALGRAGRDGARVRRGRRLPVADPRRLLEPEREGVQRLRAVLPRQLRLLGPVRLRTVPDGRDPRVARRGSCSAASAAGGSPASTRWSARRGSGS